MVDTSLLIREYLEDGNQVHWVASFEPNYLIFIHICQAQYRLLPNYAILTLGSGRAGLFVHLVPAYVVVMAIFILGEPLQLFHIVGIAVIAIGIYASTISGRISEHKR